MQIVICSEDLMSFLSMKSCVYIYVIVSYGLCILFTIEQLTQLLPINVASGDVLT